jgi:hypothetical protein
MAHRSYLVDAQERERRQRLYMAAPVLRAKFPKVGELVIELSFSDPDGKVNPSPHKRRYSPDMQAYFEIECPLRDCQNGGYDLGADISRALSGRGGETSGKASCSGDRKRDGVSDHRCNLEVRYQIKVQTAKAAAA